ncbi:MAG: class I SAM-dependent methyltransferase [Solirubrobacterales bacterium]
MLHFAPEPALATRLRKAAGNYVSVDIDRSRSPSVVADITELPFDDASFDLVLCSHVLEHVPDDGRAMREMNRVLRSAGVALIQSPVNYEMEKTLEAPGVTSPEERERLFSQPDHVRVYGRDLRDRLEAAGFVVSVDFYAGELSEAEATRQGLMPTFGPLRNDLYVCRRRA